MHRINGNWRISEWEWSRLYLCCLLTDHESVSKNQMLVLWCPLLSDFAISEVYQTFLTFYIIVVNLFSFDGLIFWNCFQQFDLVWHGLVVHKNPSQSVLRCFLERPFGVWSDWWQAWKIETENMSPALRMKNVCGCAVQGWLWNAANPRAVSSADVRSSSMSAVPSGIGNILSFPDKCDTSSRTHVRCASLVSPLTLQYLSQ